MKFVAINRYNNDVIATGESFKILRQEIKEYVNNSDVDDNDEILVYTLTHNVEINKQVIITEIKG